MRKTLSTLMFYLGLGLIFSHELDAVVQAEWRLLYVLRSLPEHQAMQAFIWLHVPLFGIVVWLTHHARAPVRFWSQVALSIFLVVHAGLHIRLSTHPLYTFDSPLSMFLIFGAALAGLAHLSSLDWSGRAPRP